MLFYTRMAGKRKRTMRDTDRVLSWFVSNSYAYLDSGHPAGLSGLSNHRGTGDSRTNSGCSACQSELHRNAFGIRHASANSLSLRSPASTWDPGIAVGRMQKNTPLCQRRHPSCRPDSRATIGGRDAGLCWSKILPILRWQTHLPT